MARLWGLTKRLRRKRLIVAICCLLLIGSGWAGWRIHAATDTTRVEPITLPAGVELRSGDIIVAGGVSLQSRVVLQLTENNRYSHVGMIQVAPDGLYVIHAAPAGAGDGGVGDRVARIPLDVFLSERGYVALQVIRLRSQGGQDDKLGDRACAYALSCSERAVAFDSEFDLTEPGAMYCSELVYLAYQQAGYRWPDTLVSTVNNLIVKGPAITPGAFTQCPDFQTVWQHSSSERGQR